MRLALTVRNVALANVTSGPGFSLQSNRKWFASQFVSFSRSCAKLLMFCIVSFEQHCQQCHGHKQSVHKFDLFRWSTCSVSRHYVRFFHSTCRRFNDRAHLRSLNSIILQNVLLVDTIGSHIAPLIQIERVRVGTNVALAVNAADSTKPIGIYVVAKNSTVAPSVVISDVAFVGVQLSSAITVSSRFVNSLCRHLSSLRKQVLGRAGPSTSFLNIDRVRLL